MQSKHNNSNDNNLRTATPIQKIADRKKNTNKEHMKFDHKVRLIVPTSPTSVRLKPFHYSSLGFIESSYKITPEF
jgi:hypothetical protein